MVGTVFSGIHPLIIAVTVSTYRMHTKSTINCIVGVHVFANIGACLFRLGLLSDEYDANKGVWLGVACVGLVALLVTLFAIEKFVTYREGKRSSQ